MNKLGYSSCNEDANSEIVTLNIQATDTVLCITGSGARVLDLLTQSPSKIIAIDNNKAQQYLLKLKVAAITGLSYSEFAHFLGLLPCRNRLKTYYQIRCLLTKDSQIFWDKHKQKIKRGILYQGNWEQHFKRNAQLSGLVRRKKHNKLLTFNELTAQVQFWQQKWDSVFWRLLLKLSANRFVWRFILRDPGFYAHVPSDFNIYRYIKSCLDKASTLFLFNQSHFAQLLFKGTWDNLYLPLHLQQQYYETLKSKIDSIEYIDQDLLDALASLPTHSVDKFSLSDFGSYTSEDKYYQTWHALTRVAKPNAIVCERQFLVKRNILETPYLKRNRQLELQLQETDQSIFYSFIIANLLPKEFYDK
ncbi:DUF3419 family protein [Legionella gresilensis]|uniref:DUF3419 family protein n=1 Tax=Legionella gresilensis TaxID=91823 RepID=UPI001040E275|nr:DUF3419 family protein [Legionella gresilensis]